VFAQHAEPEIADKSKVPYKFAGQVLLLGADGKFIEICSAQYVGANDVVMTGAHCIYSKDGKKVAANKLIFLRGYTAGTPHEASKAEQVVKCLAAPDAYKRLDPSYDYAFLKMEAAGNYGYFKLGTGLHEAKPITSVGYPRNFKDGKELLAVHGKAAAFSTETYKDVQLMKNNPFGAGASGGAWTNGNIEAVGINAKYLGNPKGNGADDNQMVSPVFDETFKKLFDFVNGDCKGTNP